MRTAYLATVTAALALGACTASSDAPPMEEMVLGPVDGHDLPATDTARVQAGDLAPDFTLMALGGEPLRLSSFRGSKNLVLIFYRGQW